MASAGIKYSVYCHHTDKTSAQMIRKSGYIKESSYVNDDAKFGRGVYLTKLGPFASRSKVAENNYGKNDGFWLDQIKRGKMDIIIALKLNEAHVKRCNTSRDVYLYKGNLKLSDAKEVTFYERGRNDTIIRTCIFDEMGNEVEMVQTDDDDDDDDDYDDDDDDDDDDDE